jgi:hypothetical protein
MLADTIVNQVKQRFSDRGVSFGKPPDPLVVFAAKHPAVGEIKIYDHGSELILVAGHFTHGHFSDFVSKSAEEAENNIAEDVIAFLDRLFADQVVMWGSQAGGGGWYSRDNATNAMVRSGVQLFVWSGPLNEIS